MSSVQRFAASSFTASWSILPNELKAEIVRHLDLASALALMRCGEDEKAVVREFGCFNVGINVIHPFLDSMVVELRNRPDNIVVQSWVVRKNWKESMVQQFDASEKMLIQSFHKTPMQEMAFSIVGRLMSENMFKVQKLEFALSDYDGSANLNLEEIVDFKYVVITRCYILTTRPLLENQKIKTDSWVLTFDIMEKSRYAGRKINRMFVVTCDSMTKLGWVRQKLIKTCIKREFNDIVIVKPDQNTVVICPSNEAKFFRENFTHNH